MDSQPHVGVEHTPSKQYVCCSDHWANNQLPIRYHLNLSGIPRILAVPTISEHTFSPLSYVWVLRLCGSWRVLYLIHGLHFISCLVLAIASSSGT